MPLNAMMHTQPRAKMPDNAGYYHVAYAAASLIYLAYALRLSAKRNKLRSRRARTEVR